MTNEFASLAPTSDPIATWFTETIIDAELNRPRTRQTTIGPSEIGDPCDRALAFKSSGAERVNYSDPLKSNLGTAFHAYVGDILSANDHHAGRYLIEHPVSYRGVSGSLDIFDRWHGRLIDIKTTGLTKIRRIRAKSSPHGHRVQVQTYAAALIEQGENVRSATLLYVPTDGTLNDIMPVTMPIDRRIADEAIDRLDRVQNAVADGQSMAEFGHTPSPLCGWCPYYSPNSPVTSRSCPGGVSEAVTTPVAEPMNENTTTGVEA